MSPSRKIVFDTDIGSDVDDALAMGLALAAPDAVELVAVTTVGREGPIRAQVAASLLGLAERRDVDVCIGEMRPLLRKAHSFNWFDHEEECISAAKPAPISDEPAPERIVRAARETPGLEVVLIGPMTNMARALALDGKLAERLGGITIMGGHIRDVRIGGHLCPPGIDYNLCSDPEASVAVLGSGASITLVPADVTLSTWLRTASLERVEASGKFGRELARQVRIWSPVQRRLFSQLGGTLADDNEAFLHDPLTLLALIDDTPLRFEELRIVTTLEGAVLRTLEVPSTSGIGAPMRVAMGVDAAAAEAAIVERLVRF